jgi:hypothetical protein
MQRASISSLLLNAVLLALVALGYGLWFGVRLVAVPLEWLWHKLKRPH